MSRVRIAGLATATVAGLCVGNLAIGPIASSSAETLPTPAAAVQFLDTTNLRKALDLPESTSAAAPVAQARVMPTLGSADPAAPPAPAAAPVAPPVAPAAPSPASVTLDELVSIVPQVAPDQLAQYVAPLNEALAKAGIDTPVRKAAFIAQLVVESDSFRTFEEYASGRAYEGRADLGNFAPGDGERYKGRGAIQVTGRHNYQSVSDYLGIDFVAHPELMATPENAFETAAWYWQSRNLNATADTAGIEQVSRVVNGGTHGLPQRIDSFMRGLAVLH
ncbi:glycoside hydrolase family 19 protein [Rhodococcus sp. AG1013]|uniref:glycoside hydrolase family 19 protein n=1 Tax=unclassified Rhodococcus (in: high G+C Gram-positive bacteria) TaxID=192944 RepID=UPI000E2CC6C2|nr:glycoside hydrolase family 19 protein [Rhodococcus sp. AG1013]RDI19949.1 putative chitinase [Rhodococcus sp. AG1013]